MKAEKKTLWELTLTAFHKDEGQKHYFRMLEEASAEKDRAVSELFAAVKLGLKCGEVKPGRYVFGDQMLTIFENGEVAVGQALRVEKAAELPGYQEWSDSLSGRAEA